MVCRKWDEFIKDMWKSNQGQKELTKKLENRWKSSDPTDVAELRLELKEEVNSIFTDNTHIFCGFCGLLPVVAVYNLASGVMVKELTPGEVRPGRNTFTDLAGGDGILAAGMWGQVLTVWSTTTNPDKMEQLHCFSAVNYNCPVSTCEHVGDPALSAIQVVNRHKVAFTVCGGLQRSSYKTSLVVLEAGRLETLACFPDWLTGPLATDSSWLAFLDRESKKLSVWEGDRRIQEALLPGWQDDSLMLRNNMFLHHHPSMKFPYLAVFFYKQNGNHVIKVYETEHLNVLKTLCLEDCQSRVVVSFNKSVIGFLGRRRYNQPQQFHQIGKKDLFNREVPPEKTFQRRITIEGGRWEDNVDLNTTSIVALQKEEKSGEREESGDLYLLKRKDFWI